MTEEDAAADEVEADEEAEETKTAPSSMTQDPNYGGLDIKGSDDIVSEQSADFPTKKETARQMSMKATKIAEAERKKQQEEAEQLAAAAQNSGRRSRNAHRKRGETQ